MRRNEIEGLLPEIFQRTIRPGNPLFALLDVMELLHAPSEQVLERLDAFFDPYRAPDRLVPYLARWVDLERFLADSSGGDGESAPGQVSDPFPSGTGRLRELIADVAFLSKWRGTAKGLLRFLETATGVQGFEVHERVLGSDGRPRPFHIRVRAPSETEIYRGLIERIIENEKPAYVTYELAFA